MIHEVLLSIYYVCGFDYLETLINLLVNLFYFVYIKVSCRDLDIVFQLCLNLDLVSIELVLDFNSC